jgi:hypothetical protein
MPNIKFFFMTNRWNFFIISAIGYTLLFVLYPTATETTSPLLLKNSFRGFFTLFIALPVAQFLVSGAHALWQAHVAPGAINPGSVFTGAVNSIGRAGWPLFAIFCVLCLHYICGWHSVPPYEGMGNICGGC